MFDKRVALANLVEEMIPTNIVWVNDWDNSLVIESAVTSTNEAEAISVAVEVLTGHECSIVDVDPMKYGYAVMEVIF